MNLESEQISATHINWHFTLYQKRVNVVLHVLSNCF